MMPLKRILRGYARLGSWLLGAIAIVGGAVVVSLLIVLPLWLAATQATTLYTVVVLALAGGGLLAWAARRIRVKSAGAILPILKTTARVAAVVALLYAMLVLFARGLTVPGLVLALVGILWLGYAASGKRTKHDAERSS